MDSSNLNAEAEADNALKLAMPEGFDAMMRLRAAKAGQPGIAPAPKPGPPDLTVRLMSPESFKDRDAAETALASLASLAYGAAVASYTNGLAAKTPAVADAYLSQGARQSLTVAALIDALKRGDALMKANRLTSQIPPPRPPPKRDRREYMRGFMQRKRALKRAPAQSSRLDA